MLAELRERIAELGLGNDPDWLAFLLFPRLVRFLTIPDESEKREMVEAAKAGVEARRFTDKGLRRAVDKAEEPLRRSVIRQNRRALEELRAERELTDSLIREMESLIVRLRESGSRNLRSVKDFSDKAMKVLREKNREAAAGSMRELIRDLFAAISEEAAAWERRARALESSVMYDPLLDRLRNRRALDTFLADAVEGAQLTATPLTLILLDVDHFKRVNDTYGHQVGDGVLKTLADVLVKNVRSGDVAARYGGEELAVVAPGLGGEQAVGLAERIRRTVARISFTPQESGRERLEPFNVTASLGVAELAPGWGAAELVRAADTALYAAKHAGRDRVEIFRPAPEPGQEG